jgi:hypothetical protein
VTKLRLDPNPASVFFDDALADGEPDSGAVLLSVFQAKFDAACNLQLHGLAMVRVNAGKEAVVGSSAETPNVHSQPQSFLSALG